MRDNGNLIRNGGFESGTFDYWTVAGGQIVQLHDTSIPGEYEAKFTVGESIFTACSTTDLLPVGPNREYEISFDLWGVHGDAISYSLQECNQDGAVIRNTQYSIASVPLVPTQITKRHVTGAGAAFAILTIFSGSEASGDYFYLNDISVFEQNGGLSADLTAAILAAGGANIAGKSVSLVNLESLPVTGSYTHPAVDVTGYKRLHGVMYCSGNQLAGATISTWIEGYSEAAGVWYAVATFPDITVSSISSIVIDKPLFGTQIRGRVVVSGASTTQLHLLKVGAWLT